METTKVTLTGIWRNTTDKVGNQLKSAKGIPYTKLSFKCKEYGDKYVGGFGNKANEGWKIGDTVDIIIKQNGEYLNFEMPKTGGSVDLERVTKIEGRLTTLEMSFERQFEALKAEIKQDIILDLGGKFQTDADFKKSQEPHPLLKSNSVGEVDSDSLPF